MWRMQSTLRYLVGLEPVAFSTVLALPRQEILFNCPVLVPAPLRLTCRRHTYALEP